MSKLSKMIGGSAGSNKQQRTAQDILPSVQPNGQTANVKVNEDIVPLPNMKRRNTGALGL